jgi:hypothetical protein
MQLGFQKRSSCLSIEEEIRSSCMTLAAIVESIENLLSSKADQVHVDRGSQTIIRAFVGRQLFVITCTEAPPDKAIPAIT